jgi:signal transduction histidine kinase
MFNIIFFALFIALRKGFYKITSTIFILMLIFGGFYTLFFWGADVPEGLLILAITIIITGILLGGRLSFLITLVICGYLIVLTYLQTNKVIPIELHWKNNILEIRDSIITSISLFIITTVSWLSNREMERSLERAEASEKSLKAERDLLEQRVAERTHELQQAQVDKITQLYRFADFGRLASGLMHDLVNPLTSVSLNIDHIATNKTSFKAAVKRAQVGIKRMESYVEAARKQVQQQEANKTFSIKDELKQIAKIFSYRQKKEHIDIKLQIKKDIRTYGNPIAFHQAMSNIVANAFDSYDGTPRTKKQQEIIIEVYSEKKSSQLIAHILIHDTGKGISAKDINHVFDPFFTTKNSDKGTGIGLSISKKAIEEKLKGHISFKSSNTEGTTFHIDFPIIKKS